MTLLLSRTDVQSLLSMQDAIGAVESAFCDLALGKAILPQRTVIRLPAGNGLHLGMPAYIGGNGGALGLKVVTIYPRNPVEHKLPTTIGVLLLSDPATGAPLAVMDAGYLTSIRTGAVGGVAAKFLARKDARTVGVFGAGVQARTQLWAVTTVRPITSARIYAPDSVKAQAYAAEMTGKLGMPVEAVSDPQLAVHGMDIIITASSSPTPVFDGKWLEPGQHVTSVGTHVPDKRELDTETITRSRIFTDLEAACLAEAGDLLIPIHEGVITKEHLSANLGDVVAGQKPGRTNDEEVTLFKSVGLAIQDISTAALIYRRALDQKVGVEFSF